jgi:hypothetical protein
MMTRTSRPYVSQARPSMMQRRTIYCRCLTTKCLTTYQPAHRLAMRVNSITGHGEQVVLLVHLDGDDACIRRIDPFGEATATSENIVREAAYRCASKASCSQR